jgi:hypothetical protein
LAFAQSSFNFALVLVQFVFPPGHAERYKPGEPMRILLLFFLLATSGFANATEQIQEVFDIDMARFQIEETPLDGYISNEEFHKKFSPEMCSANWRGYQGYWALHDNKLTLQVVKLNACSKEFNEVSLKELLGAEKQPVIATWYTGPITIRVGERKYFSSEKKGHSGVKFEAILYQFKAGILVSREIKTIERRW